MRRLSTAILAIGIALVFLLYMVTYTVGFNEIAIVTTFDKATDPDPNAPDDKNSGSVIREPGLYFKWPWPIQRVQTYPSQLQVLDDTPEQLQLSDGNTIIINLALTWRIEDPLAFFKSLGTIEEAQDKLRAQMRDLRSIISANYQFEDLVNTEAGKIKLEEIEEKVANELRNQLTQIQPSYGVAVAEVSVGKMLYTESTAGSVNERMTATQNRKAEEIRSQGDSEANAIISKAESISKQIKDFAEIIATKIEVIGIKESNFYLAKYAETGSDEDLAIYLRTLEALKKVLAERSTFVVDARNFWPLDIVFYGHGGEGDLSRLTKPGNAKPEGRTEPAWLPSPVNKQERSEQLRQQTLSLQQQIIELQAQLETLEQTPLPVRAATTTQETEASR